MVRGRVENIWRTAIFFLAVLAIIAVSNAAWAQRDEREEREQREQREQRDRYEHGYKVEHEHARPVDFGGGPGGSAVSDARCGPDAVAVGFHVQMGQFFNLIALDCAHVRPDGTLARRERLSDQAGTPGGREQRDAGCPEGMAMVGFQGSTGASIDEAAGMCVDPRAIPDPRGYPQPQLTNAITIPHPGGRPALAQCSAGQVMVGVRAKSGQWIDHLWILCSNIELER